MNIDASEVDAEFFSAYEKKLDQECRGFLAPFQILKCIRASVDMPFAEGIKLERRLFEECKASNHSKAQRHLFFAERAAAKVPGISRDTPVREINSVAVIGTGASRIVVNLIDAGIPVVVKETNRQALEKGMEAIKAIYRDSVVTGRVNESQVGERMALVQGSLDYTDVAGADLAIVMVSEKKELNQDIFDQLDSVCRESVILASSAPALDLNRIAVTIRHPENLVGLHFYFRASLLKLIEIIRTGDTANEVLATITALAKRIKQTAVTVRACPGSAGSRLLIPYVRESRFMVQEGMPPQRIDQAAYEWGMAMGPDSMIDQTGIEVLMEPPQRETGRHGAEPQEIPDEEIIERLFYPVINEGAKLLDKGVMIRPGDIDVIWTLGYGMPRYRGGPMMYADMTGLENILAGLRTYLDRYRKDYWEPAPLLERLVREGKTFGEWK